ERWRDEPAGPRRRRSLLERPAQGRVARPHRGDLGAGDDVRARPAQWNRPQVRLSRGGPRGLRLRRSAVLPRPLLRGHGGAPPREGLLRSYP
ncbi:MAG: Adenosine deaminase, partial [uncultured Rubrobacteraceae bacterium]